MPYKIRGNAVVKKDTGKVVGHSKNPKKYKRTLEAVSHGFKPTNKHHSAMNGEFIDKRAKKFGVEM